MESVLLSRIFGGEQRYGSIELLGQRALALVPVPGAGTSWLISACWPQNVNSFGAGSFSSHTAHTCSTDPA